MIRLAASNIAWKGDDHSAGLSLARAAGAEGVELAASLLWDEPVKATPSERSAARRLAQDSGLEVVGLHALTFTRPDLKLFGTAAERTALRDYLRATAELCRDLGGHTIVFGSPSARRRGTLPAAEADSIATEFFRGCAEDIAPTGGLLLIEPLTPAEADFVTSADQGAALVRRVGHPAFRLELDGRVLAENREGYDAFSRLKDILAHVQTSDPGLSEPGSKGVDHAPLGAALRASGYAGWLTLEMRRPESDYAGALRRGLAALRRDYVGTVTA